MQNNPFSTSIPYVSSTVLDKVCKIAGTKFKVSLEDVGMIVVQNAKKTYTKGGYDLASDIITFVLFDKSMNKICVVSRDEVRKFRYPKSETSKE